MQNFETVIGLEVHIQLNTRTKAFSSERNQFELEANKNISTVTLALPGTLPVANQIHIHKAIKLGLAFDCKINEVNFFDRKNYFYPDLPKGYQITQDAQPICKGGKINFSSEGLEKSIRIHHIHMEEDAGKSSHDQSDIYSLIDYNRAGTPLLELVTEPDFRSGQEVHDFLAYIQKVVQYLDVSDGNMEEGSIRCDCNVSVRPYEDEKYGERREIKNVNSKKFAKTAIDFEAKAQIKEILQGNKIYKTTMLFDPESGTTRPMRKKETENDYRYFPEPDLPPIHITSDLIKKIKGEITWLPNTLALELENTYNVPKHHIDTLTEQIQTGEYFINLVNQGIDAKELADLLVLKILPAAQEKNAAISTIFDVNQLKNVIDIITSGKVAKASVYQYLIPAMIENHDINPLDLAQKLELVKSENQDFLDEVIGKIMQEFPDKVKEYQSGKKGLIGFFVGQVKKEVGNKADPKTVNEKLITILNS
jgi:aspartyl-tRNA(Asn)/glutamyl-tRNA(Gln) amidotransferase subunit B